MELVLMTAHCWFRPGNQDYSVSEWTTTRSLFSCSLKCKLLQNSVGFTFIENRLGSKQGSTEELKTKYWKTTAGHYEGSKKTWRRQSGSDRSSYSGQCYCLSRKGGHGVSMNLIDSNQCLFATGKKASYGYSCKPGQQCKGKRVYCLMGRCTCQKGYTYVKKESMCKGKKASYGYSCKPGQQCKGKGVYCLKGLCTCQKGYTYVKKESSCKEAKHSYGSICDMTCIGYGLTCDAAVCLCKSGYSLQEEGWICVKKKSRFREKCKRDSDCEGYIKYKHVVCYRNKCLCKPGHYRVKNTDTCVRRCKKYGKTMVAYPLLGISKHNEKEVKVKYSLTCESIGRYCSSACVHERDFICKTADFYCTAQDRICYLSRAGYLDVDPGEREDAETHWIMFVRSCDA